MKKNVFVYLAITLLLSYSCSQNNLSKGDSSQEQVVFNLPPTNDMWISLGILTIHFSGHKNPNDRPPRRCVGSESRLCWQWFPSISNWINGGYVYEIFDETPIAMYRFNKNTKTMTLTFDIPTDEETGTQADFVNELIFYSYWDISHDIYIDHPDDLLNLGESRCMVIPTGVYEVTPGEYTTIKGNCSTCEESGLVGVDITLPTYYDNAFYVYITPTEIGLLENATWEYPNLHVIGIIEDFTTGLVNIRISPDFNDTENLYQMQYYLEGLEVDEPCVITKPELIELFGADTIKLSTDLFHYSSDSTDMILTVTCEDSYRY